ncbi:hypothetical protein [Pararhizobium sp. PWRC1-1]|uniref:hypothetical protein n=1 Tax=Pararhizobium sp. PWRC1-1 TaxID=2804566 RepID=UPI003CF6038A
MVASVAMVMERLGIRGRLLMAFIATSALAVLATAAALYAFVEVGSAVERITESRVPAAISSLKLSRQAVGRPIRRAAQAEPGNLEAALAKSLVFHGSLLGCG